VTDPRYDPRFQRGWDGPPPAPAPVVASAPAPTPAPVTPPPAPVEEPAPAESTDPTPVHGDEDLEPPRRNPFRIALAVLGVVLLAATGWLIQQSTSATSEPGLSALVQFAQVMTPVLGFAGFAAVIVAIAIGAVRR
jgi:hypothetical protein